MKTDLFIEFGGKQTDHKVLIDTAKKIWVGDGNKVKDLTSMELFFKPEENKCYYVFNQTVTGNFEV